MDNNETPIFDTLVNGTEVPDKVSWGATVRKAFVGATIGAATALSGTLPPQIADGIFTTAEFSFTATITIGAAIIGFAAVWAMPNKAANNG